MERRRDADALDDADEDAYRGLEEQYLLVSESDYSDPPRDHGLASLLRESESNYSEARGGHNHGDVRAAQARTEGVHAQARTEGVHAQVGTQARTEGVHAQVQNGERAAGYVQHADVREDSALDMMRGVPRARVDAQNGVHVAGRLQHAYAAEDGGFDVARGIRGVHAQSRSEVAGAGRLHDTDDDDDEDEAGILDMEEGATNACVYAQDSSSDVAGQLEGADVDVDGAFDIAKGPIDMDEVISRVSQLGNDRLVSDLVEAFK